MASNPLPQDLPTLAAVYERYVALTSLSPDSGGRLLLYTQLDRDGLALAMASNVAGAASLGLESEMARAKQAIRLGACDFLVNTLDEALRILKNELRQHKAVSVALVGEVQAAVSEMVERGVQPEMIAGEIFGADTLMTRGAVRLVPHAIENEWLAVSWSVAREPLRWLPVVDGLAVSALDAAGAARRRWLEAAPRYVGRSLAAQRYVAMQTGEAESFLLAVRREMERGNIGVAVTISHGEEATVVEP